MAEEISAFDSLVLRILGTSNTQNAFLQDVNSGLVLDHAQQPPYAMYLQVVLVRDRKQGQPLMHQLDKPRPMIPSSSAFVTAPHPRAPNQYPPPHPYVPEFQYTNSGRSTQDAVEHCSSEGEGRYQDIHRNHSPEKSYRMRKPGAMVVPDHSNYTSGAMGSPIDHGAMDRNFSIVPQGYHEKTRAGPRGVHGDSKGYDSSSDAYEHNSQFNYHGGNVNGIEESVVLSPREPYQYSSTPPIPQPEKYGRESPVQRVVSSNVPRLNLAVIGGATNHDNIRVPHEVSGRPPSVQEIARRVEGWGNNHPHLIGGMPIPGRVSSPHPEFD